MLRAIITTIILIMGLTLMATVSFALEPIMINYQGFLTDSSGNPVPDGDYSLLFNLYDDSTGGIMLWDESHPSVPVTDGLFSVQLGSVHSLDITDLGTEPLFLEILVQGQTLSPRIRFTQVPEAAYARQLKGNIETEPGSFLFRSTTGDSAVALRADGLTNALVVRTMDPSDDHPAFEMRTLVDDVADFRMWGSNGDPAISLVSSGIANALTIRGMDPVNDHPALEMRTLVDGVASFNLWESNGDSAISLVSDGITNSIVVRSIDPSDDNPEIEMRTLAGGEAEFCMTDNNGNPALTLVSDGIANAISIRGIDPSDDIRAQIGSNIGGEAGFYLFNPQNGRPYNPMVEISTIPNINANFVLFNPQPEPPAHPLLEMNTGIGGQANFRMFNPQPEPPEPLLEMITGLAGVNFNIYSPLNGRTVGEAIEITTSDSGGSMQFYDENGTHVWLNIDPDGTEGDMTFYNSDGMPTVNISSLGNIGIGTTSPLSMLHVEDKVHAKGIMLPNAFAPDTAYIGNEGNYIAFGHTGISEDFIGYKNNTFYFKDSPEGGDIFEPSVVIGGNVGIGTEAPARKLHISDVMRLEPRVDFPSSPGEGDICVVEEFSILHIYCYLNGDWRQLD